MLFLMRNFQHPQIAVTECLEKIPKDKCWEKYRKQSLHEEGSRKDCKGKEGKCTRKTIAANQKEFLNVASYKKEEPAYHKGEVKRKIQQNTTDGSFDEHRYL